MAPNLLSAKRVKLGAQLRHLKGMPGDANASGYGYSPFQIEEGSRQGWARLAVSGELDVSTALTLRRRLRALRAANTPVYLDLSGVEFIDSAGASAVLDAVAAARQSTWSVEIAPEVSGQTRRYFDLLKARGLAPDF